MHTSIHLIVRENDEIIVPLGDRGANIGPSVQVYNKDMVGGPVTLGFGEGNHPTEGIAVVDELIKALVQVREELRARIDAGFGYRALRPVAVPTPDFPVDHLEGE